MVIVGGALVAITRLVSLAIPTELALLMAYVLTAAFAINSIASILAFALLHRGPTNPTPHTPPATVAHSQKPPLTRLTI
jgi:hypothetical protein